MIENVVYTADDKNLSPGYVPARNSIFVTYIICLALAVLYSITESALVGYVNTVIILATLVVCTKQETFLFLLGLQFFNNVIPVSLGSSGVGFLLFAYIIVFIKYYTVGGGKISSEILTLVSILVLEIININNHADKPYASIAIWVLSLWFLVEFSKENISFDIHDVILYFCIAVWGICLINILEEYINLGETLNPDMYGKWLSTSESAKLASFDGRDIMLRFGTAYKSVEGTNGLTFDLVLGICLCLFGLTAKKKKHRTFYIISVIMFFYCGLLTISRGFYVEILILIVCFFYSSSKNVNKIILNFFIVLIISFAFGLFLMDNVNILFDMVLGRFSEGNNARDNLFKYSIELFLYDDSIILFGVGSHYPNVYRFTAHNMILDSLLSLGAVGCTLFYRLIIKSYKRIKSYGQKYTLFNYTPLIMLISYRMISGCVKDVFFYYFVMLCAIFTQYSYDGEGENVCLTSR